MPPCAKRNFHSFKFRSAVKHYPICEFKNVRYIANNEIVASSSYVNYTMRFNMWKRDWLAVVRAFSFNSGGCCTYVLSYFLLLVSAYYKYLLSSLVTHGNTFKRGNRRKISLLLFLFAFIIKS